MLFVSFVGALPASSMETDQYNLPPVPLADIAPEVEAFVAENIQAALDALNAEITKHDSCLRPPHSAAFGTRPPSTVTVEKTERDMSCSSPDKEAARLDELRKPDAVAWAVYERLGSGSIFVTPMGKWLNSHKFSREPYRYKADFTESIYWVRPTNYATLSPTIRMYGVEFGTDKLDHFFQQGYTYYKTYRKQLAKGADDAAATKKAVAWGRHSENTFYGYLVSGVFSNADLAANYAGLRFYLTEDIKIGDTIVPAMLKIVDGKWVSGERASLLAPFDGKDSGPPMLRPFITDHLNEAFNPSNYLPLLYAIVKKAVKKHACSEWQTAFPSLTAAEFTARTAALITWNSLDYGYKHTSRQVRLADTCFADKGVLPSE